MTRSASWSGVAAIWIAWSAVMPAALHAQPQPSPRVVVQRFRGPRGSALRRQLIRDLEDHGVVVLDDAEVRAARERLGFDRSLEGSQYVDLARELNVSAYVDGRVRRRRRRWAARIRVRNASDGERLGSATWGGRTAASLGAVRRNGYARLEEYLTQASSPAAAALEPLSHPLGEEPWYARRDVETPPAASVEDEPEETPDEPPSSTRYDAFRIAVTGGTLFRFMETPVQVYESQRGGMPADPATALLTETRRYQSGGIGHFELGARAELFPGAFDDQPFPYLGAVVSFSHSLGVRSNGIDRNTGQPVSVPTNQLDFYVGLRGRYRFGEARSAPQLRLDAGWGMFDFDLGTDELQLVQLDTIVPPMRHGYVHLSGGLAFGVVPGYFSLGLDVGYRLGTNIGGVTRNVWGIDTGPSNGFVMGVEAKVEVPEAPGLFFELYLSYFQFTTDFAGQVGCAVPEGCPSTSTPWNDDSLWELWPVAAPGPDGEPDLNAVVGGPTGPVHDNYFRMQLRVGYAFR